MGEGLPALQGRSVEQEYDLFEDLNRKQPPQGPDDDHHQQGSSLAQSSSRSAHSPAPSKFVAVSSEEGSPARDEGAGVEQRRFQTEGVVVVAGPQLG